MITLVCQTCTKPFEAARKTARFCSVCVKLRKKKTNQDAEIRNRERRRAQKKKLYWEDPDKFRDRAKICMKKSYHEDPEVKAKVNTRNKKWYEDNKEHALQYRQDYHIRNRDADNEVVREWRKRNPEKTKAYDASRRGREWIDYQTVCEVYRKYKRKCIYCGTKDDLTLEHLTPLSRGGGNEYENLAISCRHCNASKHTKTHQDYLEKLQNVRQDQGL